MHEFTAKIDDEDQTLLKWLAESQHREISDILQSMVKKQLKEEVLTFCFQEYLNGKITLHKIAEITKISLIDILLEAKNRKITFQYSIDDLNQDIATIEKL